MREAELVLEALAEDSAGRPELEGDGGPGVYRLLFGCWPRARRRCASFYEDTVAPDRPPRRA